MTDAERIARLEAVVGELKEDIRDIKGDLAKLLAAANMGKGALWIMLKAGGWLIALAGVAKLIYDMVPHK